MDYSPQNRYPNLKLLIHEIRSLNYATKYKKRLSEDENKVMLNWAKKQQNPLDAFTHGMSNPILALAYHQQTNLKIAKQ